MAKVTAFKDCSMITEGPLLADKGGVAKVIGGYAAANYDL
jgi:hypothetical protein